MPRQLAIAWLGVFLLSSLAGAVPVLEHVYARDSFVVEGVHVWAEFYDYRPEFEGKLPTFEFCANAGGDQGKIAELLARGECRTRVLGSAYRELVDGSCSVTLNGKARAMSRRGWTVFYLDLPLGPGEYEGFVRCRTSGVELQAPVRFEKTDELRVVDLVDQQRIVDRRKKLEGSRDSAVGAVFAVGARSLGNGVQTASFPLCRRVVLEGEVSRLDLVLRRGPAWLLAEVETGSNDRAWLMRNLGKLETKRAEIVKRRPQAVVTLLWAATNQATKERLQALAGDNGVVVRTLHELEIEAARHAQERALVTNLGLCSE